MTETPPEAKAPGRPSSYKPEYAEQAEKLCNLGATDNEVAEFFNVSVRTVHRWKLEQEEFCHALKIGKAAADERAERSLFHKANGFTYTEQQAFKVKTVTYKDGKRLKEVEELQTIEVERFSPPDTTAMIFWLKNRKPGVWRDRHEHGLDVSEPLANLFREVSGAAFRPVQEEAALGRSSPEGEAEGS